MKLVYDKDAIDAKRRSEVDKFLEAVLKNPAASTLLLNEALVMMGNAHVRGDFYRDVSILMMEAAGDAIDLIHASMIDEANKCLRDALIEAEAMVRKRK